MNCAKCGKDLKPGAKFCVACGTPAASSAPVPGMGGVPAPPAARVPQPPAVNMSTTPHHAAGVPQPPPEQTHEDVWASAATEALPAVSVPRWAYFAAGGALLLIAAIGLVLHFKEASRLNPPVAGKYTIKDKNISMLFPRKGWRASLADQASQPGGASEFERSGGVTLKVTAAEIPAAFPPDIPEEKITENAKGFVKQAEKLIAGEGLMYTGEKFAPYSSAGALGAVLEGTASKGQEKNRAILFILFRGNESYYFLFIYPHENSQTIRDEAYDIVNSLNFIE